MFRSPRRTFPVVRTGGGGGNIVQLVSNGGFGSDTIWTDNTWTIAAGVASAAGISTSITQPIAITPGVNYLVTFTVTSFTGGTVTPVLGGTSGTARGSAGTFSEIIKAGSTDNLLRFTAAAATLSIDDVSVVQI
jgi:branched-subunit amino acid ABC-type transport system permease component